MAKNQSAIKSYNDGSLSPDFNKEQVALSSPALHINKY